MRLTLSHLFLIATLLASALLLGACSLSSASTAEPFIPPPAISPPTLAPTPTPASSPVALPTFTVAPPPTATSLAPTDTPIPTACVNNLTFIQDITVPDGSVVLPGSSVEKEWLVANSGTCNWDGTYRLSFVGGDTLGAPADQSIYPARSGTQATLKITFIAPLEAGTYQSAWQAFAPDGSAFGEAVYMTIVVSQ